VVVVEIAGARAAPRLTRHRVGTLTWTQHDPPVADGTDAEGLRRTVDASGPLAEQLLRIRPTVAVVAAEGAS
jgi:hypothetical protein